MARIALHGSFPTPPDDISWPTFTQAVNALMSAYFYKADPAHCAFVLSADGLMLKAGTAIFLEGEGLHVYASARLVALPDLMADRAYQIHMVTDGALVALQDGTAPTSHASTRMIGGFHTEPSLARIRPASLWDLADGPIGSAAEEAMIAARDAASLALVHQDAAEQAATQAGNMAQDAASAAGAASTAAATAGVKAGEAALSAASATTKALDAAQSAGSATVKAFDASQSANAAAASADAARLKALDAGSSAGAAAQAATSAASRALEAAASQTAAAQSVTASALSAASASTKALEAAQSAGAAFASSTAAAASKTAADTSAATAQAQMSLAAGYAASAASVVQQDLSGVTAAALHRSPNPVTALFIYDTSRDSDGGAWTARCQHTSWWVEPLNGKWLGAQVSEAAARAVSGAATGDYFQRTTDGKFYSLSTTSGITEVFRGNSRDFPKLVAIVAEAMSVTLYDLTQPGRPMWMRFAATLAAEIPAKTLLAGANAITALEARILSAGKDTNLSGLTIIDFAGDSASLRLTAGYPWTGGIAARNLAGGYTVAAASHVGLASASVQSLAATLLSGAPIDPATGLGAPTIWAGTAGGVCRLAQDGTLSVSTLTPNYWDNTKLCAISGGYVVVSGGGDPYYNFLSALPVTSSASGAWTQWSAFGYTTNGGTNYGMIPAGATVKGRAIITSAGLLLARPCPSRAVAGLEARMSAVASTGWVAGDTRRIYLCDTAVGALASQGNRVANGTFDVDASGWQPCAENPAWVGSLAASDGKLMVTGGGATTSLGSGLIPGAFYRLRFWTGPSTPSIHASCAALIGTARGSANIYFANVYRYSDDAPIQYDLPIQIPSTYDPASELFLTFFTFTFTSTDVSAYVTPFDDISFVRVTPNRGMARASAQVAGMLSLAPVAAGASLTGCSGFSATSYLREAYRADLDFGTGEWCVSAWIRIPTGVSAAGVIGERAGASGPSIRLAITATGAVSASAYDGSTTRTVTTSATYATGQWTKVETLYTADGALALRINGSEAAITRGVALLTLTNPLAVLTLGNSFDLASPFPGALALVKLGARAPSAEQSAFMSGQEIEMFRANAVCVLPDAGALVDLAYDEASARWIAVSAAMESHWSGLVRTDTRPVPVGSFRKIAAGSGVELSARVTTNPGVDVTLPAQGLRSELARRAEAAARLSRETCVLDYSGGFTASLTAGSAALTNVAGLSAPAGLIGARVSGAGIPAGATLVGMSGTTLYLSSAASATASSVAVGFQDFVLPAGLEAKAVLVAGALKQEGATKDYTRLNDGFVETVRFGVAPGASAWVQIQAVKGAVQ